MKRLNCIGALGAVMLWTPSAMAQLIQQSTWAGGAGVASSVNLAAESGFSNASGHALHETLPGSVRVVPFVYEDAGGRAEVQPVRDAQSALAYYDYQGSGGTPVYPAPVCLESRYWVYRSEATGDVSWMFHVNENGLASSGCGGEIDATYTIFPAGVGTLIFSDEGGESTLTDFDHFWLPQWADGHIIEMGAPTWNVAGTIDRVDAVLLHEIILDPATNARQGFATSNGMAAEPWDIDADLNGMFESAVFDTGQPRDWGVITFVTSSNQSTVQTLVRTGSSVADTLLQPWVAAPNNSDISSAANSNQQFIQYAFMATLNDISTIAPLPAEAFAQLDLVVIRFDTDGDGIDDDTETTAGTDPNDSDSDDDGITDMDEPDWNLDTDGDGLINALDPDSDDDGLFDGTEVGNDCSHPDTDVNVGNCVSDGDAGATTTDPLNADTDSGGVSDGNEDSNLNGVVDAGETDPTVGNGGDDVIVDTDGDGLSDDLEVTLGTDPNDADTDDDGLLDGDEHNPAADTDGDGLTNPNDVDSDNDALFDGTEAGNDCSHPDTDTSLGHCRADADNTTMTFGVVADSDGGGEIDGSEDCNLDGAVDAGETDPGNAIDDSAVVDMDNDGLSDCLENTIGSDPDDGDSDDDGWLDGDEANPSDDFDGDGDNNINDPDSDGDGLFDGTEVGNDCSDPDTDLAELDCTPDADGGATTTNPLDADTDDGGVPDGEEDANQNGTIDPGERDPNDPADDDVGVGSGGAGGMVGAGGMAGAGGMVGAGGMAGVGGGGANDAGGNGAGGGTGGSGAANSTLNVFAEGGCGCGVATERGSNLGWFFGFAGAALFLARRRRRER